MELLWVFTLVNELEGIHFLSAVWEHSTPLPLGGAMLSVSCPPPVCVSGGWKEW